MKNGALAKSLVRSNYTLRTKKYTVIDDLDSLGAAWTIKPWLTTPREAPLSMARKIEKWCVGTRISNYSVEKGKRETQEEEIHRSCAEPQTQFYPMYRAGSAK